MSRNPRKSILYYWSIKYFTILVLSMIIVVITILYLIYKNVESTQNHGLQQMVNHIAQEAAKHGGELPHELILNQWLVDLAKQYGLHERPIMFILNHQGSVVQHYPEAPPFEAEQIRMKELVLMSGERQLTTLDSNQDQLPYKIAIQPIQDQHAILGYALYMTQKVDVIGGIISFQPLRLIGWITLMLCGWIIIYTLTRRLVHPIEKAADAAKQVVAGNYQVQLDKEYKEREIYDLMHSFKDMAERLHELEDLRTQLLAGVTHELKTPVTSISGLVQAVRDRVVSGQEADQFLETCITECTRLQKMVDDLLDFNSFAANELSVTREVCDLKIEINDIIQRWKYAHNLMEIKIVFHTEQEISNWQTITDPTRIEQIINNLLNNARDALDRSGTIWVRMMSHSQGFCIQVQDNGRGIPEDEQQDIFEPFYRGIEKKTRLRGLGIGLPFSRLIARSLGGELSLTESSTTGTTFTFVIPSSTSVQGE